MTNSYRKLLLTSSLILMSLSVDALSNGMPLDEPSESSLTRSIPKAASQRPSTSSNEIAIPESNLFAPSKLGKVSVSYKDGEFYVEGGSNKFQVQRWNLSKELRGINEGQLRGFLNAGYLSVSKFDEDYALTANLRLPGGGLVLDLIDLIIKIIREGGCPDPIPTIPGPTIPTPPISPFLP